MSRNLHIHIHENASVLSTPGRTPRRRQLSLSDPNNGAFLADPDDPSNGAFLADPDDPSNGAFLADPDDPSNGAFLADPDDPSNGAFLADPDDPSNGAFLADPDDPSYGRPGARPAVLFSAETRREKECSCGGRCCCSTEGATNNPAPRANVAGRELSGFLIVRLRPGYLSGRAKDLVELACELELEGLAEALRMVPEEATRPRGFWQALLELHRSGKPTSEGFFVSRPLIELRAWPRRESKLGALLDRARVCALVAALELRASSTPWAPLHSLNLYWRVDLRHHPEQAAAVIAKLAAVAAVDLVYRELASQDPQEKKALTPALTEDQGYLEDGPIGIGANWAWEHLGNPKPLEAPFDVVTQVICDLEQGWNIDHTDLQKVVSPILVYGANRKDEGFSGDHGTAVLGQMAGSGDASGGVRGAASGVAGFVLASHYRSRDEVETGNQKHPFAGTSGHVAAAIIAALIDPDPKASLPFKRDKDRGTPLQPGDVLLLEVQRGLLPTEFDAADFDAIRLATALGIGVVAAAGNGGFDLDTYVDPDSGQTWRRADGRFRDSGAIFVGAALSALPHDRAAFSNYGTRIDCFAWGETVTSCGFGDLAAASPQELYTNRFRGTSSAAPIIAGAAALLQRLVAVPTQGPPLSPRALRAILANPASGTRQGRGVPGFIGVMPNLRAIGRRWLQVVPDVYLRRTIDDDGSTGSRGALASSPDILLTRSSPPTAFAESATANFPAPGVTLQVWENPPTFVSINDPAFSNSNAALTPVTARLFVRLRNRGRGAAQNTRVQVFASPAATLISPDRWLAVGEAAPIAPNPAIVPDGDLLTVWEAPGWSSALAGQLAKLVPVEMTGAPKPWLTEWRPPVSFLAVERPTAQPSLRIDRSLGLPPAPPYFDWQEFRRFQRSRHVAWRNIHPIPVPVAGPVILPFLIAGAPDFARTFDFELIARLPSQTSVELIVTSALATKLRQRQPWLGQEPPTAPEIRLPPRPRITFTGVQLAPGALIAAQLRLTGTVLPQAGQSIAFRQVWRGEEVGRVTFLFTAGGTE